MDFGGQGVLIIQNGKNEIIQTGEQSVLISGGGVDAYGTISNLSATISNNTVSAHSGSGSAQAVGGGVFVKDNITTLAGTISGNTASAQSGSGIALAYGGGAYIASGANTVSGGSYENNQAVASGAAGSIAVGGAFFLGTSVSSASLTLAPTAGDIVFKNNSVTLNGISQANDLHFGRAYSTSSGTFSSSQVNASLAITGGGHNVYLLGGVTTDMDSGKTFTLTRNDGGSGNNFFWGGQNFFSTVGGTSTINLDSGKTTLQPGFSLSGYDVTFTLGQPGQDASLLVAPSSNTIQIDASSITLASGSKLGAAGGSFAYDPVLTPGQDISILEMTATPGSFNNNGAQLDSAGGSFAQGAYDYTYGLDWQTDNNSYGKLSLKVAGGALNPERGGSYAAQSSLYAAAANKTSAALFNRQSELFRTLGEQKELPVRYLAAPEKQTTAKDRELWFTPLYNSVRTDAQNGMARSKIKSPGFIAGYDAKISENSFIGGAISASWPDYDAGSTRTDGTDVRLALYGGKKLNSGLELSYATAYGWGDFDQTRRISGQTYGSSYNNNTFSLGAGVAKPFTAGKKLTVRPYAALEYLRVNTGAYSEGSGILALNFAKQTQNIERLRLGVDFINENSGNYFKYGLFYLGHYGDRTASATASFTADPHNPFTTFGAPSDKDSLGLTFSVVRALSKVSELSLDYTALFAAKGRSQSVNLNFSYKF